jgi:colanic acid biosynthesis glycosyl transferase WcaI
MRILFFADNFPPETNAQASRVFERARYWVRWGHDVTVITCAPNFPEGKLHPGFDNRWRQTEQVAGIRVVRVKTFIAANRGRVRRMADYLSFLPTAVAAGLFEKTPDVVAATTPQPFTAWAGLLIARLKWRPFLLEVADLWPESVLAVGAMSRPNPVTKGLVRLSEFLYRRADRIVVLTEAFVGKLVAMGAPQQKIDVVLNGVDLEQFSPRPRDAALASELGISPDRFVVGYIGTLGMAHGLENVLDAAERLQNTRILFLLVGSGAERERLMAIASARNLRNVLFVPGQPKEAVPRYWSLCQAALVHLKNAPLFETVIPSKLFEAMGMGLPIVLVAPNGEASKIVREEGEGVHVPSNNPGALALTLSSLADNPEALARMGRRSAAAAQRHSREQQARLYLAALEIALRTAPATRRHAFELTLRKSRSIISR